MKLQLLTSVTTAFVYAFVSTLAISSTTYALPRSPSPPTTSRANFSCETINGVPTTVARTSQGTTPIIRWIKEYYPESGEDPITRCVRVSGIFQTYNQQGILNYIKTGEMNGQRVICAASEVGSPCSRLLYRLDPDENPDKEVRELRDTLMESDRPPVPEKSGTAR